MLIKIQISGIEAIQNKIDHIPKYFIENASATKIATITNIDKYANIVLIFYPLLI